MKGHSCTQTHCVHFALSKTFHFRACSRSKKDVMDKVIVLPNDIYDVDVKAVIFRHDDFKGTLPVFAAIACWTSAEAEDVVDFSYEGDGQE